MLRLARTLRVGQPVVAVDTTRLGPWDVWCAGSVSAGHPLPIGWAVLPSPWPTGRCRATTLARLQPLQGACPTGMGGTLVADRGLPRAALCAQWRQGGPDCSVRLRWSDGVPGRGVDATVATHVAAGRRVVGPRSAATRGRGQPAQPLGRGWVVVSAEVVKLSV